MAYSAWVLEFLLPTSLSPMRAPVHELIEAGNPYQDVFRVAAVVSGWRSCWPDHRTCGWRRCIGPQG